MGWCALAWSWPSVLCTQPLLDDQAEGHGAHVLLAALGMVAAQCIEILAGGSASTGLAIAALGVPHHTLNFGA